MATPAKKFTTEDCLNQGRNESAFPGLNVIALQKFDLPYYELSPSLQSFVREEAVRRAGNDLLAAVKEMAGIARILAVALDGESKATDDSLAEILQIAQTVVTLAEGRA